MTTLENYEPTDFCFDQSGRDSGISSFSSDCSDSVYPSSFLLDTVKVGTISEADNALINSENDIFEVKFLGEYQLSRRHTPSMIPWVVEDICGRKCYESVAMSVVKRSAFSDYSVLKIKTSLSQTGNLFFDSKRKLVELEHCIKNITRFSKSFRNPKRFSYLFRRSSDLAFTCYVYEAEEEDVVNNLFYAIHNAMLTAPRVASEPNSPPASVSSTLYDIVYIGKVVVATKKVPPTFVDEAVKKFEELARHEQENDVKGNDLETIQESQDENVSLSSLPEQVEKCLQTKGVIPEKDSRKSSNVVESSKLSSKCRKASIERGYGTLLLIGQDEISLLSSEYKHTLKEWKLKDISFCSQGIICCNHFGFIARNSSAMNYICFIFKCQSEALVDEIMLTMRKSFQSSFEKSSRSLVVCELCPMHQFHKLSLMLENMDQMMIHKTLSGRVEHLSESFNVGYFFDARDTYDVPTLFETNVYSMSRLLKLCEVKQQTHEHINDCRKETSSFVLFPTSVEKKWEEEAMKLPMVEDINGNEVNLGRLHLDKWADVVKQRRHSVPHSLPLQSSRSGEGHKLAAKKLFKEGDVVFMDKIIPEDSPIRSMFFKVGNGGGLRTKPQLKFTGRSSSISSASSSSSSSSSSPISAFKSQMKRNGAWQINILSSLQIDRGSFDDDLFRERYDKDYSFHPKSTWKKAIGDTILLIKINKKNEERSAEDEIDGVRSRVDYLEVTPSLKEVTCIWKQLLDSELWKSLRLDSELIAKSVRDGVPKEMRGRIWRLLVHQNKLNNNNNNKLFFDDSCNNNNNNCDAIDYEILKRQLTSHQHAILIDLGRTFPGHPFFAKPSGPGQAALFNVLKAYSVLDAEVGYCQGLSFVVGVLLIHVSEREAFEILKHIMFRLDFRRQYKPDMVPLQIRMYQLTRILHDSYRDLYEHLEKYQIAPTLYAAPWFLTIFASQFPLGFVARVFDLIFSCGIEVIIKVALVLLGNHKELIKQCSTFEGIVDFLKVTLPDMAIIQMERIFNQVFQLDISKTLEAYEVEYHILHEEMAGCSRTPTESHEKDKLVVRLSRIQLANESLRRQKMELLEQLQTARRQIRTLEAENGALSSSEVNLKSQNRILELERTSLFYTIQQLRSQVDDKNNNNNNNYGFKTNCDDDGGDNDGDDDGDDDDGGGDLAY